MQFDKFVVIIIVHVYLWSLYR